MTAVLNKNTILNFDMLGYEVIEISRISEIVNYCKIQVEFIGLLTLVYDKYSLKTN